jgi:putative transposase
MTTVRTLRLKVQPDDYAWLDAAAREVNQVWNFCNERSAEQYSRWKLGSNCKPLSGYDLCNLTAGQTEHCEHIGADTIQRACVEYAVKRKTAGRSRLKWRASGGPKRALGWVPFKAVCIALTDAGVKFAGRHLRVFENERLTALEWPEQDGKARPWRDGCFAQDATGDWYLCLPVQQPEPEKLNLPGSIGIDLGLKDIAVDSDGWRVPAPRFTRKAEAKLARLQKPKGTDRRRRRTRRSKALTRAHRKVARQRRDYTHKASTRTVKRALKRGNGKIFIGDVSSSKLTQTRMAKSVLDACWSTYRSQVLYKSQKAGIEARVVSERYSTQECADCRAITGPKGREGLAVREWTCGECNVVHDRDVNSARVIRSRGDLALALEASGCKRSQTARPGGGSHSGPSPVNQERASVSGNSRVHARRSALSRAKAAARRGALTRASETGTAAA